VTKKARGKRKRRESAASRSVRTAVAVAAPSGRHSATQSPSEQGNGAAATCAPPKPTKGAKAPAVVPPRPEAEPRAVVTVPASVAVTARPWLLPLPLLAPRAVPGPVADGVALGVIALAAIGLLFETLFFGQLHRENDTYYFYYPVYKWFAEQLQAGQLPLWMPQFFSGYPLFADGETGMLYPPHWLFFGLLPFHAAFVGLRVLHFLMAGAFMYAWMRALTLRRLAALLAALTFAYGSFLVGQMHHENLLRTAVWLPLVLFWTELAYRRAGRARALCLLAGAATLGVQLTALHVQPALMTLMALGLYVAFRTFCPPLGIARWPAAWRQRGPWLARRMGLGVIALGTIVGLGLALAAAQLIPLYELGIQTFRGVGAPFAFSTSYSIHPSQYATLLFPYFFRSDTGSWQLWAGWETVVYVGVAPLLLALVALGAVRRREVAFFAGLAVFGALLSFGDYSPIPLLEALWQIPGFSALRVPGRYSLLLVVALAALAGYGLDWLERVARGSLGTTTRGRRALLGVALAVNGGVAALLLAFAFGRQWLLQHPEATKSFLDATYLTLRRTYREMNAEVVYAGLLNSLDLANRRTEFGFALLLAVGILLALCCLAGRWAAVWRAGFVVLAALDLVLWGRSFHGREPLSAFAQPPPSIQFLLAQHDPLGRLWVPANQMRSLEYNRPATWEIQQAGGYSSLEPQRHAEYAAVVGNTQGKLLDLWGVRWVAAPTRQTGLPSYKRTAFYPNRALFDAGAGNYSADERFAIADRNATDVRLIATLAHADEMPDGALLGDIVVTTTEGQRYTLPLIAGLHVSENAWERGDVQPRVKHRRAEVAYSETDRDIAGDPYPMHLYYSQHALPKRSQVREVELHYRNGIGVLRVYGLALGDEATGQVHQIGQLDRAKFRLVYADAEVRLYENTEAFPRAFVVGGGVWPRPEMGGLYSMYLDPFDPRTEVLLDEPPSVGVPGIPIRRMGEGAPPAAAALHPAAIDTYERERVVVRATAERPSYLVLTDLYLPGWRARVDGEEAPLLRGDYMFRAVPIGPGSHVVEFEFAPASVELGRLVSLAALVALVGAALVLWRWPVRGLRLPWPHRLGGESTEY